MFSSPGFMAGIVPIDDRWMVLHTEPGRDRDLAPAPHVRATTLNPFIEE